MAHMAEASSGQYGLFNFDVWELLLTERPYTDMGQDFLVCFDDADNHVGWRLHLDQDDPFPPSPGSAFLQGSASSREEARRDLLLLANSGTVLAAYKRTRLGRVEW